MKQIYLVELFLSSLLAVHAQNLLPRILTNSFNAELENVIFSKSSITSTTGTKARLGPFYPGELIFEENFDKLDPELWQHECQFSPNGEFQVYVNNRSNSFVKEGILFIRPTLLADDYDEQDALYHETLDLNSGNPPNQCTNVIPGGLYCKQTGNSTYILAPIKSARIRTKNSFAFKYGIVEVRAKMPVGDWLFPAIWLMPNKDSYGKWPVGGEIDIAETRANRNLSLGGKSIGTDQMGSTIHYGPNSKLDAWRTGHATKNLNGTGWNDDFHLFQMEWSPDYIQFSVDDEIIKTVYTDNGYWAKGNFANKSPNTPNPWINGTKDAPFDKEFYFILNLAVGGKSFFPDAAINGNGKPWTNASPNATKMFWEGKKQWLSSWNILQSDSKDASFQVDYVKVWAL